MNLYIFDCQSQQIGFLEESTYKATVRYRRWAQRYHRDIGPEPIIWATCVHDIGPELVIESVPMTEGGTGLNAYWGATEEE